MRQSIFIITVIMHHEGVFRVSYVLREKLRTLKVPGMDILEVHNINDNLIEHFIKQVEIRNKSDLDDVIREKCNLIEIIVESDEIVINKELLLIEECIKKVVREAYDAIDLYFTYLVEDNFKLLNIVHNKDEVLEDENTYDFSPILNNTLFLKSAFYDDDFQLEDYPVISSKYLLCLQN